jgi:hypothetical protein
MNRDVENIAQAYSQKILNEAWGQGHVGAPLSKQPKPISLKPATSQIKPLTQSNWSDVDKWADYFSDPRVIQQKVSGSNFSYTMDDVLNKALFHIQNPTVWKKEDVLKTAQQELKAYVDNSSLGSDVKNYLNSKLENVQNVESFLSQFQRQNSPQSNAMASVQNQTTTQNDPYAKTPYANTSQEGNLKVRNALSDYMNRVESPEEKQKVIKWLNQPAPYQLDNEGWPKDPELQDLLKQANLSVGSTRHLMTPQQKQEFDRKYKLSQEYRKETGHSPNKSMTADEIQKQLDSFKQK